MCRMEFGMENALRVAAFMLKHAESIRLDCNDGDAEFEAYFKAKIDAHMDRYGWPEGREDCENHFRDFHRQEYAKLMVSNAVKVEMP